MGIYKARHHHRPMMRRSLSSYFPTSNFIYYQVLVICAFFSVEVLCKVSLVHYNRQPYDLRTAFPSAPRPSIVFHSGNQTLPVSANSINPVGFDFSKLRVRPQSQSPPVLQRKLSVVPLAWVNLPLFDTPSFHSSSSPEVQVASSSVISPQRHDEKDRLGYSKSLGVIKSDWDGTAGEEEEKRRKQNVPVIIMQNKLLSNTELGRRIQLSNRGITTTTSTTTIKPTLLQNRAPSPRPTIITYSRATSTRTTARTTSRTTERTTARTTPRTTPTYSRATTTPPPELKSSINLIINQPLNNVRASKANKPLDSTAEASSIDSQRVALSSRRNLKPKSLPPLTKTNPTKDPQDHHSLYNFRYAVDDDNSGNHYSHSESRSGDTISGEYMILEADGYTRIVKYSADPDTGFRAHVRRVRV